MKLDFIYFLIVFIALWGEEFSLEEKRFLPPSKPINCQKRKIKYRSSAGSSYVPSNHSKFKEAAFKIDADFAGKVN